MRAPWRRTIRSSWAVSSRSLIDEIQYAPGLLPYIKMAVDSEHKTGQFWLTGSQQFLAMKGISESLAGQWESSRCWAFPRRRNVDGA
jgi:predicted AAA+ superfamily ATPase